MTFSESPGSCRTKRGPGDTVIALSRPGRRRTPREPASSLRVPFPLCCGYAGPTVSPPRLVRATDESPVPRLSTWWALRGPRMCVCQESPESPDDLQPTPVPLQESSRAGTRAWSPAAPQGRSTQRTDTQLQLRGPPGRGPGAFERGTQASWETGSSMLGSPRLSISATTLPVEWGLGGSGALCPWGTHLVISLRLPRSCSAKCFVKMLFKYLAMPFM